MPQGVGPVNNSDYQCELVSPILTYYRDIGLVQTLVRKLRKSGAIAPNTAGIHVHLDGNGAWRYGSVNGRSARLVEMEENENA